MCKGLFGDPSATCENRFKRVANGDESVFAWLAVDEGLHRHTATVLSKIILQGGCDVVLSSLCEYHRRVDNASCGKDAHAAVLEIMQLLQVWVQTCRVNVVRNTG